MIIYTFKPKCPLKSAAWYNHAQQDTHTHRHTHTHTHTHTQTTLLNTRNHTRSIFCCIEECTATNMIHSTKCHHETTQPLRAGAQSAVQPARRPPGRLYLGEHTWCRWNTRNSMTHIHWNERQGQSHPHLKSFTPTLPNTRHMVLCTSADKWIWVPYEFLWE